MVHLTRLKLNQKLVGYLKEHPVTSLTAHSQQHLTYHRAPWRVRDRLSERDVVRLIMAYKTGIATSELAERYLIEVRGARKLLRDNGVKKRQRSKH